MKLDKACLVLAPSRSTHSPLSPLGHSTGPVERALGRAYLRHMSLQGLMWL